MYYRTVNRGAFLTPQGRYTFALVFLLGLLAIASGYNGIYLSFSLGVSILVVSGLLSEKVMRHFTIKGSSSVLAEPNTPFVLPMEVRNESDTRVLYGIESLILAGFPKIGRLSMKTEELARSNVVVIDPRTEMSVANRFEGLTRGRYRRFWVLHRTLYPFGLLTKFKFSELDADVSILPAYDAKFSELIRQELSQRLFGDEHDRQFHSHRPFSAKDPLSVVDWKKSAGKDEAKWVVKVYESPKADYGVLLDPDWKGLFAARDETAYERHLSRLRTAFDVIREANLKLVLLSPDGKAIAEPNGELLASLPKFSDRHQIDQIQMIANGAFPEALFRRLTISSEHFAWERPHAA